MVAILVQPGGFTMISGIVCVNLERINLTLITRLNPDWITGQTMNCKAVLWIYTISRQPVIV